MTRSRWEADADHTSGFDIRDETLAPGFVDTASPGTPHLAALVRHTAELAQREQAALTERHRKARERYEAGVAARVGADVRHRIAETWGSAA